MNNKPLKVEQYILLSTDFHAHPFVKSIIREFGPECYALVIAILITIRRNGIETNYDSAFTDSVLSTLPDVSWGLVNMIICRMVISDFLDYEAYVERRVLTPPARSIIDSNAEAYKVQKDISRPYLFIKDPS